MECFAVNAPFMPRRMPAEACLLPVVIGIIRGVPGAYGGEGLRRLISALKRTTKGMEWNVRFVPILLQKSAAPSKCATFESNGRAA